MKIIDRTSGSGYNGNIEEEIKIGGKKKKPQPNIQEQIKKNKKTPKKDIESLRAKISLPKKKKESTKRKSVSLKSSRSKVSKSFRLAPANLYMD